MLWLCSQIALLLNYGDIIQYMIMPDEGPPVAAELTVFVPDWNIMGPGLMRSVSGGENTSVVSCYSGDVTLVRILFLVCHNCEASGYEWTHHILLIYPPYICRGI